MYENEVASMTHFKIILILLVCTSLLIWGRLSHNHIWDGDFAHYVMQAESVLQGTSSEFVAANRSITKESSSSGTGPPVAYPWGFPVMLAAVYWLFGFNILALKSINAICYLAFLVILWFGFQRYHSTLWRIAFVCLFAFNPHFLAYMNHVLSDIPFLFLSTLSAVLIGKVVIERQRIISKVGDQLLLGTLLALSFFVRTNGILLLVTLAIVHFTKLMQDALAQSRVSTDGSLHLRDFFPRLCSNVLADPWTLLLPYACFATCALAWYYVLPEGGLSHSSHLRNLTLGFIRNNIHYYLELPAEFFIGVSHARLVYGASIPLFVVGVLRRWDTDYHLVIYGVLTALLYVFWPHNEGLRFLFPLLPFYISFALTGLEGSAIASHEGRNKRSKMVRLLPVLIVLLFFAGNSVAQVSKNLKEGRLGPHGPYDSTAQEVFSFISKNTEPNSIIVFFKPSIMQLFTNRQSTSITKIAEVKRGDYLCWSLLAEEEKLKQVGRDDVKRLLEEKQVSLMYQNADFQLYRIIKLHGKSMHTDREIQSVRSTIFSEWCSRYALLQAVMTSLSWPRPTLRRYFSRKNHEYGSGRSVFPIRLKNAWRASAKLLKSPVATCTPRIPRSTAEKSSNKHKVRSCSLDKQLPSQYT